MRAVGLIVASAGVWALATTAASAAPVEYVQVCSIYGDGFFYIPGTDTCLKIGGYVRGEWTGSRNDAGDTTYDWLGKLHPEADVRFRTAYGTLRAYASGNFEFTGSSSGDSLFTAERDEAFLDFNDRLLVGWTGSAFDYTGAYTYVDALQSSATPLQARFTWMAGGYTVAAAIEDPRERELGTDFPAFVLSFSPTATWGFVGSAAVADSPYGWGVAVQVGAEWPVAVNASIRGVVAAAHNIQSYVGLDGSAPGWAWSATLSGRMALSTGLNLVGQLSFADGPYTDGEWQAVGGVHYAITQQLEIGAEVFHKRSNPSSWENGLLLRAQFTF